MAYIFKKIKKSNWDKSKIPLKYTSMIRAF